jgi:hypothetical protein
LLALVLALALTWYAMNPAPSPWKNDVRDTDAPDENRREVKPAFVSYGQSARMDAGVGGWPVNSPVCADEAGELEWPEIIDIDEN